MDSMPAKLRKFTTSFGKAGNWPQRMKNLYLDIDGVLLTRNLQIPEDAELFIQYCVQNFTCYWLTTHCKGDSRTACAYVAKFYPAHCQDMFRIIRPTEWDTLKTEAIDFHSDFYWIDDFPMEAEKAYLQTNACLDRLLVANLTNERELNRITDILQRSCKPNTQSIVWPLSGSYQTNFIFHSDYMNA